MDHGCGRYGIVSFIYFLTVNLTISLIVMQSDGRYLRPSDHGLAYQDTTKPTQDTVPEMLSFFNGGKRVSLPEAKNLTSSGSDGGSSGDARSSSGYDPAATWWSNRQKKKSRDLHKNHVREILLVTSLVCGVAGVVLIVVSAFLFVLRCRKQRQQLKVQRSKEMSLSTSVSTSPLPSAIEIKTLNG